MLWKKTLALTYAPKIYQRNIAGVQKYHGDHFHVLHTPKTTFLWQT